MKKNFLLLSLLINISIGTFCQVHDSTKDSANKKPPAPKDRNMFGLYIPRGLKIIVKGWLMVISCFRFLIPHWSIYLTAGVKLCNNGKEIMV